MALVLVATMRFDGAGEAPPAHDAGESATASAALHVDELARLDPYNRLVARGPRVRLTAEAMRDQALSSSGLLSTKLYGPPVHPFQPVNEPRTWTPITSAGVGKPEPIADIKDQTGQHLLPAHDLIAAIREDELYVFTHPEWNFEIENRFAAIEAAMAKAGR